MKMDKKNKLNVRDYITTAILFVLTFLVFAVVGSPIGMTGIGNFFVMGACALVWGVIFLALYTKVPKNGVVLIFGLTMGLFQMMNFWGSAVIYALGGVVGELFWRKLDKSKFSTMVICFTCQTLGMYGGMILPLIFLKDQYLEAIGEAGQVYVEVAEMLSGPMIFVGFAVTVLGSVTGAFIGKHILKKHFTKAGVL